MAIPTINSVLRRGILAAATNRGVRGVVRRHGMRLGAARFVAGETLDEAVPVLRSLNEAGLLTNTTLLGEHASDEEATRGVVRAYEHVLERIAAEGLRTNVALKLTHLGLDLDEELAFASIERLVRTASTLGNFIRIDMEESCWVDATLRIYRRLRECGHANVGTVLQSYLYRTPQDLESLLELEPNLRLVKGAYLEPPDVAHPAKADVDWAYAELLERTLGRCAFVGVATHDERLIARAIELAEHGSVERERF